MLTEERKQAIRERCEAATPGQWKWKQCPVGHDLVSRSEDDQVRGLVVLTCDLDWVLDSDAEFIAHAREDVPALLDEVERLEQENQRLRQALEEISLSVLGGSYTDLYEATRFQKIDRQALEGGDSE
jgi:uncharacterized protein (UPF0335 family)